MNTERIKTVLFDCRRALKLLHPVMNEEEPCVIYEAYTEAGKLLIELEDEAQTQEKRKQNIYELLNEITYR